MIKCVFDPHLTLRGSRGGVFRFFWPWMEEVICGYCPCKFLSLTMNYDWKRLFVGTVPANFYHWWVKSLLTVAPSNSEPWNYEWKRLYVGTVPANFCHWPLTMELWLEEVICGYCPCKFLSLTMNYDWKRLFVGTVPANFFIYHELWLEDICGYCPCKFLSLIMELWLEEVIGTSVHVEQVAIILIIILARALALAI